jgi:hypothetical protein
MKAWGLVFAAAGTIAAAIQAPAKPQDYSIFLSGNAQGYLAPCGCSFPMLGGAKRRATAIKRQGIPGRTLLLENGGLVKGVGRQDEIKLETFGQLHAASHGAILNLTPSEAALGPGALLSMSRLSEGRVLSASLKPTTDLGVQPYRVEGPFLMGGATSRADAMAPLLGAEAVALDEAVNTLVVLATSNRKSLLLVFDGTRDEAAAVARKFPSIALIHYRSIGTPQAKSERIGNVLLASPGDGGKHLVRLVWENGRFVSYVPIALDPSYADEPVAKGIYKTYLNRVSAEQLLDGMPRSETPRFAGNDKCGSCHAEAANTWKHSKHAVGLKTLEKIGHDRDPDCVECHVVGLASVYGFRSRSETPQLAHVGCESCHGPGKAHAESPLSQRMGAVGAKSCMPCHTVENSPGFEFAKYWARIRH